MHEIKYPEDIAEAIYRMIDLQFSADYDSEDIKAATLIANSIILEDGKRAMSPGQILLSCLENAIGVEGADPLWEIENVFDYYANVSISWHASHWFTDSGTLTIWERI